MVQTVRGTGLIVFDPLLMPFPPVEHRFLAEILPFLRGMTRAGTAVMEKAGAGAGALLHPRALILSAFWLSAVVLLAAVTGLLVWHFWNLLRASRWLWVDRGMTRRRDGKLGTAVIRFTPDAVRNKKHVAAGWGT